MAEHHTRAERAARLCMTLEELDQLDALSALIHRERVAAPRMAAQYDEACAAVAELHEETVRQRRRIAELEDETIRQRRRIAELEERFGATPATGALRSQILAAVRQTLVEDHQDAYRAGAVTTAVMGQVRPVVNTLAAEITELRAQLAATTAPHRAEARLAADARPTAGGGR